MLFRPIALGLVGGLALEGAASPLAHHEAGKKRETPSSHKLHERHLSHWGQHWSKRDKVSSEVILPMRIGLKQSNLEAGHDRLMEISTPGSASYGNHMTADEVIDFFAPQQSSVDAVHDWLVDAGIAPERIGQSVNKQWIQFDATVTEAEGLLFAEFYVWEHSSGSRDISAEEYHIPAYIQEHIDYVTPGTRLRARDMGKRSWSTEFQKRSGSDYLLHPTPHITRLDAFPNPNSTTCDKYVTAECTRAQYSIPNATTAAPGNELGIFEHLDQHYSKVELDVYFSTLYPYIPNGTYPEERLIDGAIGAIEEPFPPEFPKPEVGMEAALDFDSAWPLIYPQGTVLFQEDDEYYESTGDFQGFLNTLLDAIDGSYCTYGAYGETGDCTAPECADPAYPDPHPGGYKGQLQCGVFKPTNVISISYGGAEYGLPDYYQKRQCNEWMKLALQGVTTVISSGDDGVGEPDTCPPGPDGLIFAPDFPSNCPYILSIGSTEWDRFDNSTPPTPYEKLNEVATARFASGGGFSNIYGIPSYQRDAVDAYFDQVKLPFSGYHHYVNDGNFSTVKGGVYHHGGRAYPDVGAVGDRQLVYVQGAWYLIGGTSLSAPIWGAVLTLVNEARIAAGKETVGFIHPVIYQHPEAFNDITVGSNPGCNSTGFPTAPGWDPVTGLGSPNFPVLLDLLLSV